MADTLALENLFNAVVSRFATEGTFVPNFFGRRQVDQSARSNPGDRIVWYPGDPRGKLGEYGPAKQPGRNPRSLATLAEMFTVEITAADQSALTNDLAQYKACRLLLDTWKRAVYLAARGTYSVIDSEWVITKKEAQHGATVRLVLAIDAMVPDEERPTAPVDTVAVVATSALDNTETNTYEAET